MTTCIVTKRDNSWFVHRCVLDNEHHPGLHQDADGFLFNDQAAAVPMRVPYAVYKYRGANDPEAKEIEKFVRRITPSQFADGDYLPVNVDYIGVDGRLKGSILFPGDYLVMYNDGRVERFADDEYRRTWREHG